MKETGGTQYSERGGTRLRINSSKTEYFENSVEEAAKALKISGFNYQNAKKELMKFKDEDPIELIKKQKVVRGKPDKGVKAFFITKYDPRLPHPRQLISKNYHHLSNDPKLSNLFPRENLIGGTRRQPNLSEILSPTVQPSPGDRQRGDQGGGGGGGDVSVDGAGGRRNGSYHCQLFRRKGKNAMFVHIWQKHQLCTHTILKESSLYMATMFTCQPLRKTS